MKYFGRIKYTGEVSVAVKLLYYVMSLGGILFLGIVIWGASNGSCMGVRGRGLDAQESKLVCYNENDPSAYYLYIAPYIAFGLLLSSAAVPFIKKDIDAIFSFFDEPPRRPKA